MKKRIVIRICIAACAVLLGCNVFYTYKASKEARLCYHLAYANVRDGYMDEGNLASVKRFVKRQHSILSIMWPVRSYDRLGRMRQNLQRIRHNAIEREMRGEDGTYQALTVLR